MAAFAASDEVVASACDMLGMTAVTALWPDEFQAAFERHPELRKVTISDTDRSWFLDRTVIGDIVDFVQRVFDDPDRHAAARRIVEWVNNCPEEIRQPLRPQRLKLSSQPPEFPTKLLPPVLAAFVTEVARVRDVPVEILAPAVLGVMSGATGKGLRL